MFRWTKIFSVVCENFGPGPEFSLIEEIEKFLRLEKTLSRVEIGLKLHMYIYKDKLVQLYHQ